LRAIWGREDVKRVHGNRQGDKQQHLASAAETGAEKKKKRGEPATPNDFDRIEQGLVTRGTQDSWIEC
jgi:hypothetical protein